VEAAKTVSLQKGVNVRYQEASGFPSIQIKKRDFN